MNHKILMCWAVAAPFLCIDALAGEANLAGEFVKVPGGMFEMGCGSWQSDCEDNEKPVQTVTVGSFEIGKYEVTQGQWKAMMGSNPSRFSACGEDCPVEQVTWSEVQEFIKKLNAKGQGKYRLPTEAEWEYACRSGGKPEPYCGGDDADKVAWYKNNSSSTTHPVGQKSPNGLGIYDMSGNVFEWTCSEYDKYGGSGKGYTKCSMEGPHWVFRGGSWHHYDDALPSSRRNDGIPGISFSFRGFRLVRD